MATQLADILFVVIATAIVVAQAFILRSTARGMEHAGTARKSARKSAREWVYAIVPAVALLALLACAWCTMHPRELEVRGIAPGGMAGA